jgi:hypothetical protein
MIRPFIDTLYSIAIGIGFTQFPAKPQKNVPAILFFALTLVMAAADWYYYRTFEDFVSSQTEFLYYLLQVITVLILSQMFRHASSRNLRIWICYFIIFVALGAFWNWIVSFSNYGAFLAGNVLLILTNIALLFYYSRLESSPPLQMDIRYTLFAAQIVALGLGYVVLMIFNR